MNRSTHSLLDNIIDENKQRYREYGCILSRLIVFKLYMSEEQVIELAYTIKNLSLVCSTFFSNLVIPMYLARLSLEYNMHDLAYGLSMLPKVVVLCFPYGTVYKEVGQKVINGIVFD